MTLGSPSWPATLQPPCFGREPKVRVVTSCQEFRKVVDETVKGEYGDFFPHWNKLIVGVKIPFRQFFYTKMNFVSSFLEKTRR